MNLDDRHRAAGALCIDLRTRTVVYRGAPVELTATEFRILEFLNAHPGWVLSPGKIADSCLETAGGADSIVVHVSNLRGKLSRAAAGPTPIETVRGFGYRLRSDSAMALASAANADSGEALGDELTARGSLAGAAAAYVQALDANAADELSVARIHVKAAQIAIERHLLMEAKGHCSDADKILNHSDSEESRELLDDVQVQRAWLEYYQGEFQDADDRCEELLARMDHRGTPEQRMQLHACALMSLLSMHRFVVTAKALRHAWSAYDAWEDTGDLAGAVYAESLLGSTLLYSGNTAGGEERLTDALRMSEELGEHSLRPHVLGSLGIAARWRGEVRLAETVGARLLQEANELGPPESTGVGHGLLCWVAWRDGNLDKAVAEGAVALQSVQLVPVFPFWWLALAPLIAVAFHRGQLGDAIGYAHHILDPSQQVLPPKLTEALVTACSAWDAGNDSEANAALSLAVVAGRADGYM